MRAEIGTDDGTLATRSGRYKRDAPVAGHD
jgi:hypothetical protein